MHTEFGLDCAGLTDTGRERQTNQDQFLVASLRKSLEIGDTSLRFKRPRWLRGRSQGQLLMVADGMGGMTAGEEASRLVIDTIVRWAVNSMDWFFPEDPGDIDDILEDLLDALRRCQSRLERAAHEDLRTAGMGTTLTLGYIVGPVMHVVHIGDSRAYLWREGKLSQITTDHTVAQQLADAGAIQREEVETSQWSHVLWNALHSGETETETRPAVYQVPLQAGDVVLLCSDGLTKHLDATQIGAALATNASAALTCRTLVNAANAGGGSDNVTVVAARILPPGAKQPGDPATDSTIGD